MDSENQAYEEELESFIELIEENDENGHSTMLDYDVLPIPTEDFADEIFKSTSNMVYRCRLGISINLDYVCKHLPVQLNIKTFPGLVIRISTDKKAAVLLFESGMMVFTGIKSQAEAHSLLTHIVKTLRMLGYKITEKIELTLTNMVVTVYLNARTIDIKKLAEEQAKYCCYNPSLFPGAIIRHPGVFYDSSALTFKGGRIVFVGAANQDALDITIKQIYSFIKPYTQHAGTKRTLEEVHVESKVKTNQRINAMVSLQRDKKRLKTTSDTKKRQVTEDQSASSKRTKMTQESSTVTQRKEQVVEEKEPNVYHLDLRGNIQEQYSKFMSMAKV